MFDIISFIKAFLVGGGVIGTAKFISTKVNSVWAALVGGAPQGIISAFFIPESKVRKFFIGYIIQSIVLTVLIVLLNVTIIHSSININVLTIITLVIWLIISVIMIHYNKKDTDKKSN